jgi:hypothetical protein
VLAQPPPHVLGADVEQRLRPERRGERRQVGAVGRARVGGEVARVEEARGERLVAVRRARRRRRGLGRAGRPQRRRAPGGGGARELLRLAGGLAAGHGGAGRGDRRGTR